MKTTKPEKKPKKVIGVPFKKGNKAAVGSINNGRPGKYNAALQKRVEAYFQKCYVGNKPAWIEQLALIVDVEAKTLAVWARELNEDGTLRYPEFAKYYYKMFDLQKWQLMERGSSGLGQSFNAFLLSANFDMIPAEKRVVTGDPKEPLVIELVEEGKKLYSDDKPRTNDSL